MTKKKRESITPEDLESILKRVFPFGINSEHTIGAPDSIPISYPEEVAFAATSNVSA